MFFALTDEQRALGETVRDFLTDRFDLTWHPRRQGFMATVRDAWTHAATTDARYIFHAEDDFTYNELRGAVQAVATSASVANRCDEAPGPPPRACTRYSPLS